MIQTQEIPAARVLCWSITRLSHFVQDFDAAVDLFEMAASIASYNYINRQFRSWQFLAARDGAMTIYHFARVLKSSGESFKDCPNLRQNVDHKILKDARKMFLDRFPMSERIRHSIAHRTEMTETKEKFDLNSFSGTHIGDIFSIRKADGVYLESNLYGNKYVTSYEGKILSYEISHDTTKVLADIASMFYSGFDKIRTRDHQIST